jgi:hypothetical protein
MGRTIVFVGANIEPSLYASLQKKFPSDSDTSLILKGLNLLLKCNDKTITVNMKQEFWDSLIKKAKEKNIEIENITGELLYRWMKGELKLENEN